MSDDIDEELAQAREDWAEEMVTAGMAQLTEAERDLAIDCAEAVRHHGFEERRMVLQFVRGLKGPPRAPDWAEFKAKRLLVYVSGGEVVLERVAKKTAALVQELADEKAAS